MIRENKQRYYVDNMQRLRLLIMICSILSVTILSIMTAGSATDSGYIVIRSDGSVEPYDAPVQSSDNVTYILTADTSCGIIIKRDDVLFSGEGHTLQTVETQRGFDLTSVSNVSLVDTAIRGFPNGIFLQGSKKCAFRGISISDCGNGIFVQNSLDILVSSSNISENEVGIYLLNSNRNVLEENNIVSNSMHGIYFGSFTYDNQIVSNNIIGNAWGIQIRNSLNNTLTRNTIAYCRCGLSTYSSSGTVSHNNFMSNLAQVDGEPGNTWNKGYPYGGNYWSGYYSTDFWSGPHQNETGSDGIWDQPFKPSSSLDAIDNYPFVEPLVVPPRIEIVSPGNGACTKGSVELNLTVSKITTWMGYSLNGQENVTFAGNQTLILPEGPHGIRAYAIGIWGMSVCSGSTNFIVDDTPPRIEAVVQVPPESVVPLDVEVLVKVSTADSVSGVRYVSLTLTAIDASGTQSKVINMTSLDGYNWEATLPSFAQDTNVTYTIRAEDLSGNAVDTDTMGCHYYYCIIPENVLILYLGLFSASIIVVSLAVRFRHADSSTCAGQT